MVLATVYDVAGNSFVTSSLPVTVDRTKPDAPDMPDLDDASDTGASITDNLTNDATPLLNLSGFGTYHRLFRDATQVSGDYATASSFTEPAALADATYAYTLYAVDVAGNVSDPSAALNVTVDTTAPGAVSDPDLDPSSDFGQSNTDDITNVAAGVYTGTFTESEPWKVELREAGALLGEHLAPTGGFYTLSSDPLSEGEHDLFARLYDLAGNWLDSSAESLHVWIDLTAPTGTVPDLNPLTDTGVSSSDDITQGVNPQFDGTASDPLGNGYASGVWKVDVSSDDENAGTDSAAPFYGVTLPNLAEGSRTVWATVYDVAGNFSQTDGLALEVDRTRPTPPDAPDLDAGSDSGASDTDDLTNDSTPTLNLSGFSDYYRLYRDGGLISASYGTATPYTEAAPLADGTYGYRLSAVDAAGNESALSGWLDVTIDTAGPRVSDLTPAPGSTVGVVTQVVARFNEDLDPASIHEGTFKLSSARGDDMLWGTPDDETVAGAVLYDLYAGTATFTPSRPLRVSGEYGVWLDGSESVMDPAGNPLDGEFVSAFPSGDGTPGGDFIASFTVDADGPRVNGVTPAPGAALPSVGSVQTQFSEPLDPATIDDRTFLVSSDPGPDAAWGTTDDTYVPGTVFYSDSTLTATFTPDAPLPDGPYA
ncbi:MAG: hypothetical protein FJ279_33480, partial [Planctomycetes bacterium]|nr:hypothetical protein [Planctomycetota bacterium]